MIIGYFGPVGAGKTLKMVMDARRMMQLHATQIYSVMGSLHFPRAVYLDPQDIGQLAQVRSGIILCDEAGVILNGRFWHDVPRDVLSALAQSRHNGLDLYYTAQYEDQVDKGLREITSESIHVRPVTKRFTMAIHHVPGQKREVTRRRLMRLGAPDWHLYDTLEIVGREIGHGIGFSAELQAVRDRRSRKRGRLQSAEGYYRARGVRRFRRWLGLSPEAEEAFRWLRSQGVRPLEGRTWRDEIVKELGRREWLSDFGLRFDDVGVDCGFDSPWEPGWDPFSVKERARVDKWIAEKEREEYERDLEAKRLAAKAALGRSNGGTKRTSVHSG